MELTRIGSNNWGAFSPIVYDAYTQNAREVLRIGGIEDGEVCASLSLSYFTQENIAFVDSVYVVPRFRGRGFGHQIVEEACRLAASNAATLEAEFIGDSEDSGEISSFFNSCGFATIPGEPIYDYDVKKLLSNRQYSQYCKHRLSGVRVLRFSDMTGSQKNYVFNLLAKNGERNTETNTAGFSPELSVAVYRQDDMRKPRACLIAIENQGQVTIAQLYGSGRNNPKFILASIFGFTENIKQAGGAASYANITMLATHPGVKKVFELLFGKRLKPTESGLVHAVKFLGV